MKTTDAKADLSFCCLKASLNQKFEELLCTFSFKYGFGPLRILLAEIPRLKLNPCLKNCAHGFDVETIVFKK